MTPRLTLSPSVLTALLATVLSVLGGLVLAFGGPLIAVALVLGIVGAIIVLRDIKIGFWGVILVVCILPFATLPIDIGVTPSFLDCALGAAVGVWLLRLVTGQQTDITLSPVTLPILLFLIVAVFAFIFGMPNGIVTGTIAKKFAELLLSIGFVVVVVDYFNSWERIEQYGRVILIGAGVASFLAIFIWVLPNTLANTLLNYLAPLDYPSGWIIRHIEENPALAERAIGTSIDPNALGGLLTLLGAFALPQLFTRQPLLPRRWAILITVLIYVAMLLTFSRGAFLALGSAVAFMAVVRYRQLIPYAIGAVALLFVLPFTQAYVLRLVQGLMFFNFNQTDLASQMRLGEYRDALQLIGRYPLFGVGFLGAPDLDLYLGVANVYLSIAQQMGLLGLLVFSTIIVVLFGTAYFQRDSFRQDDRRSALWLGFHASIVGGLVAGLFDHYLFNTEFHHTVTAFWLLLGLSAATTRLAKIVPNESKVIVDKTIHKDG